MSNRLVLSAAAVLAWLAPNARGDEPLNVGDPAPMLQVKEFLKGEPVKSLEKGKTYVVEFWATWCPPCRESIPHLSELQKQYKDVTFIGVSAFEHEPDGVKPFVAKMGDKMDYRVAIDDVPEGGEPQEGKMAQTWMEAAAEPGIPTAFVVNSDGLIAWIGHPMSLEKPLDQIAEGKYDLQAAARERRETKAREAKLQEIRERLIEAQQSGDPKRLLKAIDGVLEEEPTLEATLAPAKFQALRKSGEKAGALGYARKLVDSTLSENAPALNNLAWMIVDPEGEKPGDELAKVALGAARRADELEGGKDGQVADTLARALFVTGDAAKAVESEERALKLSKGTPFEDGMQERLDQYRKAAEKPADQG